MKYANPQNFTVVGLKTWNTDDGGGYQGRDDGAAPPLLDALQAMRDILGIDNYLKCERLGEYVRVLVCGRTRSDRPYLIDTIVSLVARVLGTSRYEEELRRVLSLYV